MDWEQREVEKKKKIEVMKKLIISECQRVVELLESNAEETFDGYYGKRPSSELFKKMHELRRDTITLEKTLRGEII